MNFSDKLAQAIRKTGNPTVMGLDPMLSYIPEYLRAEVGKGAVDAAAAVGEALFAFNAALIDATADIIPMVKPQLAYYEQYGVAGLQAFERTCRYAHAKGMLVLADGKRNDIGSTAQAYANAYLGETVFGGDAMPVFGVDALTVNGYLGEDGINPFLESCDAFGKGIFVLVKTSNPSSGQLQDLPLADGRRVYEMMADLVSGWGCVTRWLMWIRPGRRRCGRDISRAACGAAKADAKNVDSCARIWRARRKGGGCGQGIRFGRSWRGGECLPQPDVCLAERRLAQHARRQGVRTSHP